MKEDFHELVADPLRADGREFPAHGSAERPRFRAPQKTPASPGTGLPAEDGACPHRISPGISDAPDDAGLEIRLPADKVEDRSSRRVEEKPVHGEIAAEGVHRGIRKSDGFRMPSVGVGSIRPEGRHLTFHPVLDHHDHPELRAHCHGAGKEFLHFLRTRAGCDVDVVRLPPEQAVPDAAAREERLMAVLAELLDDPPGRFFHCYLIAAQTRWTSSWSSKA